MSHNKGTKRKKAKKNNGTKEWHMCERESVARLFAQDALHRRPSFSYFFR
jgi:hypothetical protein